MKRRYLQKDQHVDPPGIAPTEEQAGFDAFMALPADDRQAVIDIIMDDLHALQNQVSVQNLTFALTGEELEVKI